MWTQCENGVEAQQSITAQGAQLKRSVWRWKTKHKSPARREQSGEKDGC